MTKGIDTSPLVEAAIQRGLKVDRLPTGRRTIDDETFRRIAIKKRFRNLAALQGRTSPTF